MLDGVAVCNVTECACVGIFSRYCPHTETLVKLWLFSGSLCCCDSQRMKSDSMISVCVCVFVCVCVCVCVWACLCGL